MVHNVRCFLACCLQCFASDVGLGLDRRNSGCSSRVRSNGEFDAKASFDSRHFRWFPNFDGRSNPDCSANSCAFIRTKADTASPPTSYENAASQADESTSSKADKAAAP